MTIERAVPREGFACRDPASVGSVNLIPLAGPCYIRFRDGRADCERCNRHRRLVQSVVVASLIGVAVARCTSRGRGISASSRPASRRLSSSKPGRSRPSSVIFALPAEGDASPARESSCHAQRARLCARSILILPERRASGARRSHAPLSLMMTARCLPREPRRVLLRS